MVTSQQVWEDQVHLVSQRKGHGQGGEGQEATSGLRLPTEAKGRESSTVMERTGSQRGEV